MIKLLDKTTIDKIAAGEVIERPSSVVKELLENSIDAQATSITVEIKEGGTSFIRVTDNGCGIPKDEVRTAYMRHATSKIETADDLYGVASLGFRGEALSTIAAVSQTEMITKTAYDLTGIKYVIHGGEEIEYAEVGVPDGTTIVVRNLFFNTPARKKFLKTPMTEGSYIQDLVQKLAMSHPEISFRLISNGQTKMETPGNGKIKDTIYQLFGRDITSNLIEINHKDKDISITGYIGKPFISRGNRGLENYFINNRYIKSNIINRAIEEGYKTFVMQHKFPFTVLYIELPAEKCDVNVHPTKMEFKYDNERELFEVITKTIREALTHKEIIPKSDYNTSQKTDKTTNTEPAPKIRPAEPYEKTRLNTIKPAGAYSASYNILETLRQSEKKEDNIALKLTEETKEQVKIELSTAKETNTDVKEEIAKKVSQKEPIGTYSASGKKNPVYTDYSDPDNAALNILNDKDVTYKAEDENKQTSLFDDDFLTEKARTTHRLIGQLFDTYWLIEYNKNLYIMDQHAAHEKVKYEELLKSMNDKEVFAQQIMPPMVVTVSYAEREAILEHFDLFFKVGFDIEEFGGNEFKINAVPSNIYDLHGRTMFLEFVGSLINNSGYVSNDIFVKKLSTMACKAAIKGNTQISYQEANQLIEQLLKLDNPYTCPHGRPTIISISERELEKKFKRVL